MGPKSRATVWLVLALSLFVALFLLACGTSSNTHTTPTPPAGNGGGTGGTGGGTGGGGTGGGGTGGGTGGGGSTPPTLATTTIVSGINQPWEMAFAPDGRMFFTERSGNVRVVANGALQPAPVYHVSTLDGLDGLTGLALDPAFATNHRMFIFYCTMVTGGESCRIERIIENGGTATFDRQIFEFPTVNRDHVGGRMKIGPDGLLYLTTGDQQNNPFSQDPSVLPGKILRMDLDGNPRGAGLANPYVYAMGFRDPEGLAWDSSGALYASDHGPVSNDEIDLVQAGGNYGWPTCIGRCGNPAFIDPVKLWSPETAAPSGITFYSGTAISQWNGSLLVGLLGQAEDTYAHHLHEIKLNAPGGSSITAENVFFKDQFGRIRNVVEGPDGLVYFCTSNGNGSDVIVQVSVK